MGPCGEGVGGGEGRGVDKLLERKVVEEVEEWGWMRWVMVCGWIPINV